MGKKPPAFAFYGEKSAFIPFLKDYSTYRTYFLQVKKCNDSSCTFHKQIHGNSGIDSFSDTIYLIKSMALLTMTKNFFHQLWKMLIRLHNCPPLLKQETVKNVGFTVTSL